MSVRIDFESQLLFVQKESFMSKASQERKKERSHTKQMHGLILIGFFNISQISQNFQKFGF